jgi:hypothetical protein
MKFPSVNELANYLDRLQNTMEREIADSGEEGLDIRLQVTADRWDIHAGDPSYDTDHHGAWGSSALFVDSNVTAVARELIDDAKDMEAQNDDDDDDEEDDEPEEE